jgi:predicted GH43/DUF377 family glycosyl hydrolase
VGSEFCIRDCYKRHGPRIAGDNKNCVILPQKIGGSYVVLHRPMPRIELIKVPSLEDLWPGEGTPLVGPLHGTWRSSRVGSGAPPVLTDLGWLLPFHGATAIEDGNIYSMGWCVLDKEHPERVLYVSEKPALTPTAEYEIQRDPIPQVEMANFKTGVRVVFPQGLVERGEDLIVYYGAADMYVAAARVNKRALVDAIASEIRVGGGARPL